MENCDSGIISSPQEIDYMQSFFCNIEPLGNSSNQNLSITFRKKLKLPKQLSVYILLLPFLITFHYTIFWSGWVCIPLSGNIPLPGKFSLHFVYIFRTGWNFLIQFCNSNPSYNRNIVRSLHLKFKTSAHAQITITHYYVLFTYLLT